MQSCGEVQLGGPQVKHVADEMLGARQARRGPRDPGRNAPHGERPGELLNRLWISGAYAGGACVEPAPDGIKQRNRSGMKRGVHADNCCEPPVGRCDIHRGHLAIAGAIHACRGARDGLSVSHDYVRPDRRHGSLDAPLEHH